MTSCEPIYISGPHGVGKTTLMHALTGALQLAELKRSQTDLKIEDPFLRVYMSSAFHCSDLVRHREQCETSNAIGDRCVIDSLAYLVAFNSLGWIEPSNYGFLRSAILALLTNLGCPRHVILLNSDAHFILSNVARRGVAKGLRQSDESFAKALVRSYDEIFNDWKEIDSSDWLRPGDFRKPTFFDECARYVADRTKIAR